jgi:hypothetical protein
VLVPQHAKHMERIEMLGLRVKELQILGFGLWSRLGSNGGQENGPARLPPLGHSESVSLVIPGQASGAQVVMKVQKLNNSPSMEPVETPDERTCNRLNILL